MESPANAATNTIREDLLPNLSFWFNNYAIPIFLILNVHKPILQLLQTYSPERLLQPQSQVQV